MRGVILEIFPELGYLSNSEEIVPTQAFLIFFVDLKIFEKLISLTYSRYVAEFKRFHELKVFREGLPQRDNT